MSKRKFKEFHDVEVSTNSLSEGGRRALQELPESVLERCKKELSGALRIARGVERQKLGRRQKTAKESNAAAESVRLNTEVAALKVGIPWALIFHVGVDINLQALDLSAKAELHLYKSMLKSKPIASAPTFPSYILAKVKNATQPQDIAHANVQARLFNSKVVKAAMSNIMDSTRAALGIANGDLAGNKQRLRAADYTAERKPIRQAPLKKLGPGEILAFEEEDNHDCQLQSTSESFYGEPDVIISDNENVNLAAYEDRLAESENESLHELYLQKPLTEHKKYEQNPSSELSLPPSRSLSSSSSIRDNSKPSKIPATIPKSTIFLPSLTMGGYISDSESAISDLSSIPGNTTTKPRKNRRGQQERRQIWERKYGKNANHVKRQGQKQQQNRDHGWDARKGAAAVGGDDQGKRGRGRERGRGRVVCASTGSSTRIDRTRAAGKGKAGPISSGANSDPVQARRGGNKLHDTSAKGNPTPAAAAESTRLHPSWEAAKRQKEAKKNVAFQGKKVVFD